MENKNRNTRKRNRTEKDNKVKDFIEDYASNSNLHGLKYIGEKDRTISEKIFWLFVFVICVGLCGVSIWSVGRKWYNSPVIVSFTESMIPVTEIPFPAITICPETKALQTKLNFTDLYRLTSLFDYLDEEPKRKLTEQERKMFEDVSLFCDSHLTPDNGRPYSSGLDILNTLLEVSPDIYYLTFGCKIQFVSMNSCEELYSPILTDEGICFTFNSLCDKDLFRTENLHQEYLHPNRSDVSSLGWDADAGYSSDSSQNVYPRRGMGAGAAQVVLLKSQLEDFDYLCRGPAQGYKILLHNPAEFPRMLHHYFKLGIDEEVKIAVKPKITLSSDGLKVFETSRRQCYFQDERPLRFFKIYTQSNCETECWTNYTYHRCHCAPFGLPYGPEMTVCNAGKVKCLEETKAILATYINNGTKIIGDCGCLPACNSIHYDAELSTSEYNWKNIFRAYGLSLENVTDESFTRLMVFFKESHFDRLRRAELYSLADVMASCGGLLGLFMGFSLLSLVEIIYFVAFRCNKQRARKTEEKISPNSTHSTNLSP